ncbi:alpha/beta fold hydrolase [Paenibacillus tuaregi]|uniref:alpha/beta fold hydrolase n=1 Tax=Paenibacillus tuaregi TaxID=1816681 RepID=UPI0008384F86|nr:alpha/beta hydrolase [Paenibacillus tuaregi]
MKNNGILIADGFELAYRIEGSGHPVLVVGSSLYYPRLFSKAIREHLKLIFVDHRGFVKPPADMKPEDYGIDRILNDIERFRQELDLERFSILGHSGHAFLAAEYAVKYPEYIDRVILLNSAPTNSPARQEESQSFFSQTADPGRLGKFEKDMALLAKDLEQEPERRFAHLLIRMGAQSFYDYHFDASYMWEGVYTNMPVIDHLWGEAFANINLYDRLPMISKPVFLGLGRYDYLVAPLTLWDGIEHKLGQITKVVFERSGHNPMFEEAVLFDTVLLKWMNTPE